jgi:PKD repeat protein
MIQPSRIAKRFLIPVLLAATLVVAVQVVLAQPPTAALSISEQQAGGCGTFTFTSNSTDPEGVGDIQTTEWDSDFDGTFAATDSGSPVAHTYDTPGTRTVRLRVVDAASGDDTTEDESFADGTLTVTNANPPTADIAPPTAAVHPNEVATFSAAGSADPGGGITKYEWDLDGTAGFEQTTTVPTATHTYATAGTRTVRVRVTDTCNVVSTIESASITVVNTDPSFTIAPNPAQPNVPVSFTAVADPAITNYAWDLDGDGTFETDTDAVNTAQKTYTDGGTFVVGLEATYTNGAKDTAFKALTVNFLPEANFTFSPNPPVVGEPVTFQPTGSRDFAGGTITAYEWDLDGNGSYETPGANPPAHVYTKVATVSVGLRVTDNNNGKTEFHKDVAVLSSKPNPGLTFAPANPLPGQAVTLTSTSTPSTTAGAPALQDTQWDFDYPLTEDFSLDARGGSVVTSFATPGPKSVALKVTDASGGFAIAKATIPVNAPPIASFTIAPAKPIESREVTFASTSSDPDGPITNQEWDLDNDNRYERAGAVVSTKKLKKGTRTIRLRVTDSKGATTTTAVPVRVGAKPLKGPVRVQRRIGFAPRQWGIKLVALLVKVPARTTVTVKCTGRGCPKGTFKKRTKKKAGTLTFDKLKGSVRAGARITVVSAHTGHVTAYDTYIVRGGERGPLLREQCKLPGKKKPQRCPKS